MIKDEVGNEFYGCIYLIDNTVNEKIYLGQTKNFKIRKMAHWGAYGKKTMPIDRSIYIHGNHKFNMQIIEYCETLEDMNETEEFWIAYYKSIGAILYNIRKGGKGFAPTINMRKNMSQAQNGKKHSAATKAKIGIKSKGRVFSKETCEKISKSKKGKKLTEKHKAKIRANAFFDSPGFPQHAIDKAAIINSSPIIAIDELNNKIHFCSIKKAGESLKISKQIISSILTKKRNNNVINGYTFIYKEDDFDDVLSKSAEESLVKILKSKIKNPVSLETREKISKIHLGRKRSAETKLNISKGNIGKHNMTPERSKIISEAQSVPVIIIDKFGNEYNFPSVLSASISLNISRSGIFDVLALNQYVVGDSYTAKYANHEDEIIRINKKNEKEEKKKVIAIDTLGNERTFNDKDEVRKVLNISISSISKVYTGKLKSTGGYTFKFFDKE